MHYANEIVNPTEINPIYYDQLEKQGCIGWVERPEIIMPKFKKPKAKRKYVRKSKS